MMDAVSDLHSEAGCGWFLSCSFLLFRAFLLPGFYSSSPVIKRALVTVVWSEVMYQQMIKTAFFSSESVKKSKEMPPHLSHWSCCFFEVNNVLLLLLSAEWQFCLCSLRLAALRRSPVTLCACWPLTAKVTDSIKTSRGFQLHSTFTTLLSYFKCQLIFVKWQASVVLIPLFPEVHLSKSHFLSTEKALFLLYLRL